MFRQRAAEHGSHRVQRLIPTDPPPTDFGMEQAVVQAQGFAQRRAFRTQPPVIGGMLWIARHPRAAGFNSDLNAAADAAVRAGGADRINVAHRADPA